MKKLIALVLAVLMAVSCTGALAAKNPKINADDLNFEAIIDDTEAEGTVNIYHWWTAGGEKDAIESVVAEFSDAYENTDAKSNPIPGGAGGAMVMKVKVLSQSGYRVGKITAMSLSVYLLGNDALASGLELYRSHTCCNLFCCSVINLDLVGAGINGYTFGQPCADDALFDENAIKDSLKADLATFKIPSVFFVFESFPIAANGKLDQRALKIMMLNRYRDLELKDRLEKGVSGTGCRRLLRRCDKRVVGQGRQLQRIDRKCRKLRIGF